MGCEGRGFFSLFGGQPQQCGPLNNQIQQMRANLDRVLADLQRLQGNSADREGQRRAILAVARTERLRSAIQAVRQSPTGGGGNFFENLFGGGTIIERRARRPPAPRRYLSAPSACAPATATISRSPIRPCRQVSPTTNRSASACARRRKSLLYSHRNPGEDMSQAISTGGRPYSELPNAFAYRKAFNPSCSCRAAGPDLGATRSSTSTTQTIEQGDIVVTEEQAKALSQPADPKGKAAPKGKGAQPKGAAPAEAPPAAPAASQPKPKNADGKPSVRTVGPPSFRRTDVSHALRERVVDRRIIP